jgi:hypothetical protein
MSYNHEASDPHERSSSRGASIAVPVSKRASPDFHWPGAALAGIVAGVVATVFQVGCWGLAGQPPAALLFRDARLTAAIVMGPRVLPPPPTFDASIFVVATLVHFALSIAYGLVLCAVLSLAGEHLGRLWRLVAGAAFGVVLYAVNMHGATVAFPWFAVARGGITLATHAVFGMAVVVAYGMWPTPTARSNQPDRSAPR